MNSQRRHRSIPRNHGPTPSHSHRGGFAQHMKASPQYLISCAVAGVAFVGLLLTGCTREERATAGATAKEMISDSKAALGRGWDKVKSATYDKRGDVEAHGKALAAEIEAQASKLRASYSDAKASASRKAA